MTSISQFSLPAIAATMADLGIACHRSGASLAGNFTFKSLRCPGPRGIYFVVGSRPIPTEITPSVVVCDHSATVDNENAGLHVRNPQLVFYKLMQRLVPTRPRPQGIHPTAVVDAASRIAASASIGPYCVIEGAAIGERVRMHAHVVVMPGTVIEDDVIIEPHSTLGATGVAWIWDAATNSRVVQPQAGSVRIGAGSFLGSDVTVVRGSVNEITTIGPGTVIAHGSKIGHGCVLQAECHLANNVSLAGNVTLGLRSFVGAGAVVRPQVRLADETVAGAGAVVVKSIDVPRAVLYGNPAAPHQPADCQLSGVPHFPPPTDI